MAESPLASLNRGLIQGFQLGQQGLRTQRQLEADKTLRELQERRIGIEEEGLKLRKRQINISERSALANLIKIPNPKTRKLAVKAFLRGKDIPVDDPAIKDLLDGLAAMEDDEKAAAVAIIQSFDLGMGVKEMQAAGLLSVDKIFAFGMAKQKQGAAQKFQTKEREAGEQTRAEAAGLGPFGARLKQSVEAGVITQDKADELRIQNLQREAAPRAPLVTVDFSGLEKKERTKALTKLNTDIRKQKQAAFKVVRLSNRITGVLGNDAKPLAIVGFIARVGNSVSEQAQAIASAAGLTVDPGRFKFDAFPETAVKSVQVRTNVLALAFAVARAAEPGGRLSDRDVQLALNQLAAGSGSTLQMRAALGEVVNNALDGIDDFIAINEESYKGTNVNSPSFVRDDLKKRGVEPLSRLGRLPEGVPEGSKLVDQTVDGLPVYETPDGEKLVVF